MNKEELMNLKEANKQLEKLENDYDYYLKEKEEILSLVMPVATDIRSERIDGGSILVNNREDKC